MTSFADREELFLAVFDARVEEVFQAVVMAVADVGPAPADQLRAAIGTFLHLVTEDARTARVIFSEPAAGSDLAGIQSRAVQQDDGSWKLNGQKVWTTNAQFAAYGLLLARTDPDAHKHKGLTMFIVPMDAPGVTVRGLRQITGDAEFNEVFFDHARIPDAWRLGPVGDGWRVAITTLMNERVSLSGPGSVSGDTIGGSPVERIIARYAPVGDPMMRQRLAAAWIDHRVIATEPVEWRFRRLERIVQDAIW